jgi:hypothetical protein
MYNPETVAFEILSPFKTGKSMFYPKGYRHPIITIWHHDPCKDGSDDSCGRFIRERHVDKEVLDKIKREFHFNIEHNYWFTENGVPIFSTQGILIQMYTKAYWIHCNFNRDKLNRFMRKHLYDILYFAENPTDCAGDSIINKWGDKRDKFRFVEMAATVYTDILRKERKWYQHPKWHFWHWSFQIIPLQRFKRRYFDKCSICGKRGFKGATMSDWHGTKMWHPECSGANNLATA